jgi:hypothetical protein
MTNAEKIITKDDYVLTNIDIEAGRFVIKLTDNQSYYVLKDNKGYFVNKTDGKYYLDKQVKEWFDTECDTYNREGI